MKSLVPIVLLLCAAGGSPAQTADPDRLEEFVREYEGTWQAHSAERLAEYFAEDCDMVAGIRPRIAGRAAIEKWWETYFSRLDTGRMLSISIESIRVLGPDVALLNVDTTTGGAHSETNEPLESRRARGTWIVTRTGGDWRISAIRMHSPVGEERLRPGTDN